jgi:mono/diheme cytochrome c family protein
MAYRRYLTLASSIVLSTLFASLAFADAPGAAEIYKSKCAMCHGADGSSQTPAGKAMKSPDLRSADVQKQTDADLQKAISEGKGKMAAYKSKLSVADISSLVAYVRGLAKK